ncbi:Gla-3 [Aphelenchoides bicaudatus]|nr:Gla-3 [Aphelenchoides bicaudatus]
MKKQWKNPALYKTRLCDNWAMERPCSYGTNCWYAHGPRELRNVPHLDSDPVAKSSSLAEVLNMFPQDRKTDNSANQSTSSNEEVDTFVNVTVPTLNALVAQMTRPQQLNMAGSMEETKKDLEKSMPNFVKKLSDFYAAQRFLEQGYLQSPVSMTQESTPKRPSPFQNHSLGSNSRGSIDSFTDTFSSQCSPLTLSSMSIDEADSFDLIHQRFDNDCDHFFT